ncbi:MAG TPA: LTA synthase family protein [Rhodanobacteraceae bacterium]|nr:LTA synthase family protein [Rhodanobacteraceae bacterium]
MKSLLRDDNAKATLVRVLLMTVASVALVVCLDPALQSWQALALIWRNALPVLLVMLFVYALSARTLFAIWMTLVLTWLLFTVNTIKVANMNMPLMPGDLVLVHQILHNLGFFEHYTVHGIVGVIALAIFLLVSWGLWRIERHGSRPSWVTRTLWVIVPAVFVYTMFAGVRPWPSIYSDQALAGFQLWDPAKSVDQSGLVAGLVRMSQEYAVKIPKADKAVVRKFADKHADAIATRAARQVPKDRPDIVVVQSEAFFDPGIMKQIDYGQFDPNFSKLSRTGISGALTTPAYGGGTIRTEFETLTGYPMGAFPSIVYPYYGLASRWMPSVPTRLVGMGYSTTLFHPFLSEFWDRGEVMPQLGFQKMYFESAFHGVKRAGLYVSDQGLFDFVLDHLKDDAGRPQFVMVITMENHGPWERDPGQLASILQGHPLPTGLSPQGTREMRYYLSHLVNGDAALGNFAKRLLARKHWTILVFYGDHLPALDAAFKDVGFDDGGNHSDEHTRYMLLSNRPLQPRTLNLDAYQLPGLLFDTAGLPMNGYLAFDGAVRQAEVQDHFQDNASLGQVLYNAARLEVACRSRITFAGTCGPRQHPAVRRPTIVGTGNAAPGPAVPAPSVTGACANGSCANGELSVVPAKDVACDARSAPHAAEVTWNASGPGDRTVRIWIHNPGTQGAPTLWTEQPRSGSARTGPWVMPGTVIILTGAASGRKLSALTVQDHPCASAAP